MSPVQRDPNVAFGRYTLRGTGIKVIILRERNRAGETIKELAEDYGIPEKDLRAAFRWWKKRYGT